MFGGVLNNITVSVTRDASLTCVVENLSTYKVRNNAQDMKKGQIALKDKNWKKVSQFPV